MGVKAEKLCESTSVIRVPPGSGRCGMGSDGSRVLILGGGFAGLSTARELAKLLPEPGGTRITLVDSHNFSVFTPMLTEVVSGQLDARHIAAPLRRLSDRVEFQQATVEAIDLPDKRATIRLWGETIPGAHRTLQADHLVIALGSVTSYHHLDGVREHSLTMKSLGDAAAIYNRAVGLLERAGAEHDTAARRELLTFVVAGGGFSGVETMAALNDFVRGSLEYYPEIRPSEVRMLLVHPHGRLLPELGDRLARYAQKKLERRGVEVVLNTKVQDAGAGWVELQGGRRLRSYMLIWTAGEEPNPLVEGLPVRRGKHGGIVVDPYLAVPGHPGVWALGDCAEVPKSGGGTYGPTAQNATREGRLVARNIAAALSGRGPERFSYRPLGELALVGRRSGVASVRGLRFSGLPAWAMWRAVYLAKMPGAAKRARIAADWLLDLAVGRDPAELPDPRTDQEGQRARG
jgi:NADH dehydrogenase